MPPLKKSRGGICPHCPHGSAAHADELKHFYGGGTVVEFKVTVHGGTVVEF